MQGNLGSVNPNPGILCPMNARSIPSSKFPVMSAIGTLLQPAFPPHPRQAPRSALQRFGALGAQGAQAVCTWLGLPVYDAPAWEQTEAMS